MTIVIPGLPLFQLFGFEVDPVLVLIVAVLLGFVFALYLMLRRTIAGFQEGMSQGRNR